VAESPRIGFYFWCWKECESIARRAIPQIEIQFELHRVLVSRSRGRNGTPRTGAKCGQNHLCGDHCNLPISILFNPKNHASIDNAPGPTKASPAPMEARRIAGQRVSWKIRISVVDRATDRIPAAGVHNPAISTVPFATSSKPRINGKSGSPWWILTLPSTRRAAPAAIRINSSPRAGRPPTKLEMNRRTSNPK